MSSQEWLGTIQCDSDWFSYEIFFPKWFAWITKLWHYWVFCWEWATNNYWILEIFGGKFIQAFSLNTKVFIEKSCSISSFESLQICLYKHREPVVHRGGEKEEEKSCCDMHKKINCSNSKRKKSAILLTLCIDLHLLKR